MPCGYLAGAVISNIKHYNEFVPFMPYLHENEGTYINEVFVNKYNKEEVIRLLNIIIDGSVMSYLEEFGLHYTLTFSSNKSMYKCIKKYIEQTYKRFSIPFDEEVLVRIKKQYDESSYLIEHRLETFKKGMKLYEHSCMDGSFYKSKRIKVNILADYW